MQFEIFSFSPRNVTQLERAQVGIFWSVRAFLNATRKRELLWSSKKTGWFSSKGLKLLFTTNKISNAPCVFLWEGVTERESSIPIG